MLVCCYSEAEATITSNVCQKIARGAPMDSRDLASWTNKIYGKIKKALCRKDMERWTCNICVMNKTLKMIHMAILIGILWYSRFSRSFCKKQMFGISMEQASTKGMMHYLEHSSNSTIIYIYIMIYTLWFIYIYIYFVYIYTKRCSPLSTGTCFHCLLSHIMYTQYTLPSYILLRPLSRDWPPRSRPFGACTSWKMLRGGFNRKIERVGHWWCFCWHELRCDSVIGVWRDWYFHIGFLMMSLTSPARGNAVGWILSEWPCLKLMKNSMWVMQPGVRTII